jgi:nitrite reductase (NADH) small subunit
MAKWVRVASLAACQSGSATEWVAGDQVIALFNVDGTLYALDGICPHQGGPLGKGCLEGTLVTCPWHGWQFDVRTGQHQVNQTLCHTRLDVKAEEGSVFVLMPDPDAPRSIRD